MINKTQSPMVKHRSGHRHYRGDFVQQNIDFYERIDAIKDQIAASRVLRALNKKKGGEKI